MAYPNLNMAQNHLGCLVNDGINMHMLYVNTYDGINTHCMLQNCGSVFYCLSQCCIYRKFLWQYSLTHIT